MPVYLIGGKIIEDKSIHIFDAAEDIYEAIQKRDKLKSEIFMPDGSRNPYATPIEEADIYEISHLPQNAEQLMALLISWDAQHMYIADEVLEEFDVDYDLISKIRIS